MAQQINIIQICDKKFDVSESLVFSLISLFKDV